MLLFATELLRVNKEEQELTPGHRRHITKAFKTIACATRDAWHSVRIGRTPGTQRDLALGYRKEIEKELVAFVSDASDMLEAMMDLVPNHHHETKVCLLAMVADLHRYVVECDSSISFDGGGGGRGAGSPSCDVVMKLYTRASVAAKALAPGNPVRLGVALNLSVFCKDILNDTERARSIASSSFDLTISQLDELNDSRFTDSAMLMQMLRDNLALWRQNDESPSENSAGKVREDSMLGGDLL